MTIFLNVTDAISPASHHGITRTERQLAVQLAGRAGVQFVVLRRGRLWCLDAGVVAAHLDTGPSESVPVVERFGVDPPTPAREAGLSKARRLVSSRAEQRRQPELEELTEPAVRIGDALVSVGLDWVHGFLDEAERWVYGAGARYFGFCYDMIPVDHPEWLFPADPVGFMQHFRRVTGIAESVLCISECTRADFIRHFPDYGADRVRTIVLGADAAIITTPEHDRFAQSLFDGEPFAVYCATIDRRKNHQLLYRVVKECARRGVPCNVAFVGKIGSGVDDLLDSIRHDPLVAGRIVRIAQCDDAHLAAIYRRARFAVYPSLYEGWGLGVTEALAHGTPCIVATGSSLGEAGLGVCTELHPLRTGEWVDAMTAYFAHPPALPSIEIPTWKRAADSIVEMVGT